MVKGPFNRSREQLVPLTIGTGAYGAGDVVGGLITFDDLLEAGGGGTIRHVYVSDDSAQGTELKLYIFNDVPTTLADNAVFEPLIADLDKLVGIVTIESGNWITLNSNTWAKVDPDISFESGAANRLYGYLVTTPGDTWAAATDLKVKMVVWAD